MAVGVRVMAAFRGRSLVVRFGFEEVVSVDGGVAAMGFVFCASASVSLMLWASGWGEDVGVCPWFPVSRGGRLLLISGDMPAIDVSGMFVLRGGGGAESREWGRYSVAVENFRLAACCIWQRRHVGEGLERCDRAAVLVAVAASLKRLYEGDVKGSAARWSDILPVKMRVPFQTLCFWMESVMNVGEADVKGMVHSISIIQRWMR